MTQTPSRPALRLIRGALDAPPLEWAWFCGHCAAPPGDGQAPAPVARVCQSCSLGLMLEAPRDAVPSAREAFLVVDSSLLVQALSLRAEALLGVPEEVAVHRPVGELLVPADAEAQPGRFASAVLEAAGGSGGTLRVFVRPGNTFGVRMSARISPCGPPRAALLVLDEHPRGPRRA
jgi:hypothetical protein